MTQTECPPANTGPALPSRRAFVAFLAAAMTRARAWAAARSGEAIKLRLGIDTYTLRALRWKALELLDYAAATKIEVVQFSEWPHLGTFEQVQDDSYLKSLRAHADKLGLEIEMGTWTVCPTNPRFPSKYGTAPEQLRFAIHIASVLGSKSVRCVMGSGDLRLANGPLEKHVESMIGACRAVRDEALAAGVHIAIENHKDLRATEMRDLVEAAGPDHVGVCLDTGNAIEVLENPVDTVEVLAPYAVTSHFRDTALWKHPRGAAFQWTAMGDGGIGIGDVVRKFAELCPAAPLNLEIITGRPPKVIPYREPEFWKAFPNLTARDFLRFVELVERGQPSMAGMVVPSNAAREPAYREAVKQQQRVDFERSVKYCRDELHVAWNAS
jgi:sugar phosphate isomerase/epimerase